MPRKKEVMKEKRERNPEAFGISGFTLSIVSLFMFLFPIVGIIESIIGIILCGIQQGKKRVRIARNGMIINIVSLIWNIAWWVVAVLLISPQLASLSSTA